MIQIHGKTGVMEITLRSPDEPMQGDISIPDRNIGVLIDIVFTSNDGKRKRPVASGEGEPIDLVLSGGHPIHFTSDPDAIEREYHRFVPIGEIDDQK